MPDKPPIKLDLDTITPEDLYNKLLTAIYRKQDVLLMGCAQPVALVSTLTPVARKDPRHA